MVSALLFLFGIVVIVAGIGISIGLHELGHLTAAKIFGVKVTQYFVGFGPTLWSRKKGETEYGVKALPFGGYIAMTGMFPPGPDGEQPRRGRLAELIDSARQTSAETVQPGEEHRAFYAADPWKRIIIMFAGPVMNLVIAVVVIGIITVGVGVPGSSTTVASVAQCLKPATSTSQSCDSSDAASPAAAAGLRAGDKVLSVDGTPIRTFDQLSSMIEKAAGRRLTVVVERDGKQRTLHVTPVRSSKAVYDAEGHESIVETGVVGITPTTAYIRQPVSAVPGMVGDNLGRVAGIFLNLPQRMVQVWNAAFGAEARDPNGPVGLIGVGRFAGEVASDTSLAFTDRLEWLLSIIAALNMSLFVFNMIPLLPLDGGHILGALWEQGKRWFFAIFRRGKTPKHVDMARLMPITFGVVTVLIAMELLLAYADIVKPISAG
ncbi:M50 family metallopeptidase [Gryllotalpicola ginsengisoli]|uniref:M50 family metallopeptidase n=1 Tax=Gryllotalpicola ginsengisoli TaxID=444608 RepID=UPI0003B370D8|nr:site-2 protease family protein [Gryllotalpicola ginsengisoli]